VTKAILAALVADGLLLAFILLRRAYRRRYFAKLDRRTFEFRQKWDEVVSGRIPYANWRKKSFDDGSLKRLPWTLWKRPVLMRPPNYCDSFAQAP